MPMPTSVGAQTFSVWHNGIWPCEKSASTIRVEPTTLVRWPASAAWATLPTSPGLVPKIALLLNLVSPTLVGNTALSHAGPALNQRPAPTFRSRKGETFCRPRVKLLTPLLPSWLKSACASWAKWSPNANRDGSFGVASAGRFRSPQYTEPVPL